MASVVAAWPTVALRELMTQDTTYLSELEPRLYPKISVKWWGKGAVPDTPTDGAMVRMTRHQLAKPGQVIVSEIWAKHGSIGIVPLECASGLVTSHFYLFDIDATRLAPRYMDYIIQANYLTPYFDELARGTTGYASVRPRDFLAAEIPLPPLDEQRRIVGRVEALAARIEQARGLRREAMVETRTIASRHADQAIEELQADLVRLADLLCEDSLNGLGIRPADDPPGTPILRISAGTTREDAIVDEGDFKYLACDHETIVRYGLRPGDLLACRFNGNLSNVGRFSLYSGYSGMVQVYPDKLIRFRVDTRRVSPAYVRISMNSRYARQAIESFCATTAGNIGISAGNLKTIGIPLPSVAKQESIVAQMDELNGHADRLRRLQAETAAELDALLPAVLDQAFRGEL